MEVFKSSNPHITIERMIVEDIIKINLNSVAH